MNPTLLATLAVVLVAGCSSSPSAAPTGAVGGRVLSAPSCPVQREGVPCPPRPVAGAAVDAVAGGRVLASTHTDARGFFHLAVPSGRCTVRATNAGGYQSTASRVVLVRADRPVFVRLVVDSGIR